MNVISKLDELLKNGVSELDRRLFSHGDEDYVPVEHLLVIPLCSAFVLVICELCAEFFLNLEHKPAVVCALWMMLTLCGVNVLLHIKRVFALPAVHEKLLYFVFLAVASVVSAYLLFLVTYWVVLLFIAYKIIHFITSTKAPPARCSTSKSSGGGNSGNEEGEGGGSGDDGTISLDNGDTVRYDPMTGYYRSTDPIADNYYEKQ